VYGVSLIRQDYGKQDWAFFPYFWISKWVITETVRPSAIRLYLEGTAGRIGDDCTPCKEEWQNRLDGLVGTVAPNKTQKRTRMSFSVFSGV
jgi:hypothetical protein